MRRSDANLQTTVVQAITRHTIKPIQYQFSFLPGAVEFKLLEEKLIAFAPYEDEELPILIVFLDIENWTFVTTRKVVSMIKGSIRMASVSEIKDFSNGDFKDYMKPWRYGRLALANDEIHQVHIEGRNASIMMIYGINTLTTIS